MAKVVVFAAVFCATCAAQAPASKTSLQGQVVSATGAPLKNATLRLQALSFYDPKIPQGQRQPAAPVYTTTSDAAGNFVFEAVDPAGYNLSAQRTGYLAETYSPPSGSQLALVAGQPVTGITIKMIPEAQIEGKITNEDGESFANARVSIFRWAAGADGSKQFLTQNTTNAAQDGSFVIGGLRAGYYYVSADAPSRQYPFSNSDAPQQTGPREAYIGTYYPGTPDVSAANSIAVTAGAIVRGVDIRVRKAPAYRIRGRVVTPPDVPAIRNPILFFPDSPRSFADISATAREDGTFQLNDVLPGTYIVQTQVNAPLSTYQQVTVGKEDLDNVVVRLTAGVEVDASIKIENNGPQTGPAITLPTIDLSPIRTMSNATPERSGGTTVFRNLRSGKYLPRIGALPAGTYVKSVRLAGQDVTGKVIDLTSGIGGALDVVLSPHAAGVSGTLRNSNGDPLPEMRVTLWAPEQPSSGGGVLPKLNVSDASGLFRFGNLAPGEYRIAAWERIDQVVPIVPEFLSQLESKAATVRLDEDAQLTVDAPIIDKDTIDAAMANVR